MDVSIIIVNYKTGNFLIDCIKSIIDKTDGIRYEIIVVDNNSEPDIEEKVIGTIQKSKSINLKFIELNHNIGFGKANNKALEIAVGRNIFFLNPDTLLKNNALKILSEFLDKTPDAGACGGNIYSSNLEPSFSYKMFFPGILWETDEFLHGIPQKILYGKKRNFNPSDKIKEISFISGAAIMVRKNVIQSIGGFDPDFFMFFEDTDLCFRINKTGWKLFNLPAAQIIHLSGGSFKETRPNYSEYKIALMEKSRMLYYKKLMKPLRRYISHFIYSLFLISRVILVSDKDKKDYYKQRLWYFMNE